MTQKLLQEKAAETFVKNINIVELVNTLDSRRDSLAKWVLRILDLQIDNERKISYIIHSLFDRAIIEPGETIAYANTSRLFDEVNGGNYFGEVLAVYEYRSHVFIRCSIMDNPFTSFEISMYDVSRHD